MTLLKTFARSICFLSFFSLPVVADVKPEAEHGFAMHGELKYASDFTHFDYTNPQAPKGGTLRLAVVGDNFDSLNPYIIKGVPAAGSTYLYQGLTEHSLDEAFS